MEQAVEHAPAVTHRSVHGFRSVLPPWDGGTPSPVFKFHHEEIVPAAFDGKNLLLGPSSSRMFEVWAPRTEGGDGSSEGDGLATQSEEKLLGLAKVSLVPFAAFFGDGDRDDRRWKGVGLKSEFLCVAVDGPVSVIDPFSGKAVGELRIFIALRAPPSVTVTQGTTARSQSLCLGTNEIGQSPKQDVLAPLKARGMSRRVERKQRTGFPEEIADEVKGRSMGDTSSDSHAELSLDDSVTGERVVGPQYVMALLTFVIAPFTGVMFKVPLRCTRINMYFGVRSCDREQSCFYSLVWLWSVGCVELHRTTVL